MKDFPLQNIILYKLILLQILSIWLNKHKSLHLNYLEEFFNEVYLQFP